MTDLAITLQAFGGDDDFWALREFLAGLGGSAPPGQVWDVRRWDGAYFYSAVPGLDAGRASRMRLWREPGRRIVAALVSEGGCELHPHLHPDVSHMENDVLAVGERIAAERGDAHVTVLCYQHDAGRRRALEARGYGPSEDWAVIRRLRLGAGALKESHIAAGYRMRTTRPVDDDHQRLADLLNASFGRNFHVAAETRGFQAHSPSFRRDLDLVAEAPDGTLAAYAAVCWDDRNKVAIFEPVCTHPDHRQRGLAKSLMLEGLRRARNLGARIATVETGSMEPANALYDSIGFAEEYRGRFWRKEL